MTVVCPLCRTKFEVAEHIFGDKKLIKFQCSRCKTVFRFNRETGAALRWEETAAPSPPATSQPLQETEHRSPAAEEAALPSVIVDLPPVESSPSVVRPAPVVGGSAPQPVQSLFASSPYVLELDYALEEGHGRGTGKWKAASIAVLAILLTACALYLFVTWKNDWDFAAFFTDTQEAFAIAMGGKEKIEVAPEARGLEAAITTYYITTTSNLLPLLVVEGEVLNTTPFPKKHIRVHVAVFDRKNQLITSQEVPGGVTLLTRNQVQEKTMAGLNMHIELERKTADEWVVNSGKKVSFQAFFLHPPAGVDDPTRYFIEATAISAVNALAK